jgi:hypothetical protein
MFRLLETDTDLETRVLPNGGGDSENERLNTPVGALTRTNEK